MISVIIPTYNRAKTIERSAQSVLNQTYKNIELIIVDDCSEDNTKEIVDGLMDQDRRIRYIRHDKNSGACAARNTGIDAAEGEIIAFQDSDDAWRPEKLEKQLDVLKKYNADICYCKMLRHNYPSTMNPVYPELPEGIVDYETLISKSHASTQLILGKAEVFHQCKFDVEIKQLQDFDWCIRAGRDNVVAFADEVLVDVFLQENSIFSPKNYKKTLSAFEKLLAKYPDICEEVPAFHVRLLNHIGKLKMQLGDLTGDEYKAAYKVSGNTKYLVKYWLYKTNILSTYYKIKKILHLY